jgi:hypothetical protein
MRPAIYMDFARSGRLDPRARVIRASGGTRRGPDGVWREVGANTARLHWSADGAALGLLMEPGRANLINNPRTEPGSGAGLPTGYVTAGADTAITTYLAQSAIAGVQGRRVQVVGTTAVAIARFLSTGTLVLASGPYVFSRFAAFIAGWGSVGAPRLQSFGGGGIGDTFVASSALARYTLPIVIPEGGGSVALAISTNPVIPIGAGVNLDAFIGWDGLEAGLYATTPILPAVGSPGSATRAAETLETLLADWGIAPGTEGTLLVAGRAAPGLEIGGASQRAIQVDLGSAANAIRIDRLGSRQMRGALVVGGNSIATASSAGTVADSADFVAILAYDQTSMALTLNGAAPVETATGQGISPTRILLGDWGGTIERFAWWPRRLPNAQAQSLSRQGVLA